MGRSEFAERTALLLATPENAVLVSNFLKSAYSCGDRERKGTFEGDVEWGVLMTVTIMTNSSPMGLMGEVQVPAYHWSIHLPHLHIELCHTRHTPYIATWLHCQCENSTPALSKRWCG